jgi:hypothetical protein
MGMLIFHLLLRSLIKSLSSSSSSPEPPDYLEHKQIVQKMRAGVVGGWVHEHDGNLDNTHQHQVQLVVVLKGTVGAPRVMAGVVLARKWVLLAMLGPLIAATDSET